MLDETTRFEVRNYVKGADRASALIQAGYDTINRMTNLFAGITFGEQMTQPFKTLVPRILSNLERTAGFGLIDDPEDVAALFTRIMEAHGDESFQSYAAAMCDEDARLSREMFMPVWKLWQYHGIKLPEFSRFPERNGGVKEAIDNLIALAPDFTYRSFHETPRSKDLKAAIKAVHNAVEALIIYLPHNGLCCLCSTACECIPAISTDYCVIIGVECSGASSNCTNSPI